MVVFNSVSLVNQSRSHFALDQAKLIVSASTHGCFSPCPKAQVLSRKQSGAGGLVTVWEDYVSGKPTDEICLVANPLQK